MPLPSPYRPFSEVCIAESVSYQQWQKTAETDKILNLLYDQIDGRSSTGTATNRALALLAYLATKSLMTDALYADAPADIRLSVNELTYNNALVSQGEGQFGLCGRFHRVLTTVLNEMTYTGSPSTQAEITDLWLEDVVGGLLTGLSLVLAPVVSEFTMYQINSNEPVLNTGAIINVVDGVDSLTLLTAAVGENTQIWEKDAAPVGGQTADSIKFTPIVLLDAGVYRNSYTNAAGTSYSSEFNVAVA